MRRGAGLPLMNSAVSAAEDCERRETKSEFGLAASAKDVMERAREGRRDGVCDRDKGRQQRTIVISLLYSVIKSRSNGDTRTDNFRTTLLVIA